MGSDSEPRRQLVLALALFSWTACTEPHIVPKSPAEDAGQTEDHSNAADAGIDSGSMDADGGFLPDAGGRDLGLRLVPSVIARGVYSKVRIERTSDDRRRRVLSYESRLPIQFSLEDDEPQLAAVTIPAGEAAAHFWMLVPWSADAPDVEPVSTEIIAFSEQLDGQEVTTPVPFEQRTAATQVVQGRGTTCLLVEGRVLCLGENTNGQAGIEPEDPLQTFEAPHRADHWATHRFKKLSMEAGFTCGIETERGGVWCWGQNGRGQLGRVGVDEGALNLTNVESDVTDLDVGEEHACAVRQGLVYCWGRNDEQQVRAGASLSAEPTLVHGLPEGMSRVAVGTDFSCAMTNLPAEVYCWGANDVGQLGRGTTGASDPVPALIDTTALGFHYELTLAAAGRNACLISSGDVYCWGDAAGFPEQQEVTSRPVLTVRQFDSPLNMLSMGKLSSCASSGSGAVCWGNNTWKSLQVDRPQDPAAPSIVQGLPSGTVWDLSSGGVMASSHCAIIDGLPWCWGFHPNGELGIDARVGNVLRPRLSPLLNAYRFSKLRIGGYSDWDGVSCFLSDPDHALHCWGWGYFGQFASSQGQLPFYDLWSEPMAQTGPGVLDFDIGYTFMLKSSASGVTTVGSAGAGELGNGTGAGQHSPGTTVEFADGLVAQSIAQVSAGAFHACVIATEGERGLYCWGFNASHAIGLPSTDILVTRPAQVISGPVTSVATAADSTCAVTAGKAQCWGGNTIHAPRDVATDAPPPQFVEVVTYGQLRGCARSKYQAGSLTNRGELWCWQDADLHAELVGEGFMDIDGSGTHACGLKAAGERNELYCWGDNQFGQLGAGDRDEYFAPVKVERLVGTVHRFECGGGLRSSTCAEDDEGWKCWGNNTRRQFEAAPWVSPPTLMLPWQE